MDGLAYSTFDIRVRAVQAVLKSTPITQVAEAYQTDRSTIHVGCLAITKRVAKPAWADGR
jgi:hypothetical protein